jgi:hypothetical protein
LSSPEDFLEDWESVEGRTLRAVEIIADEQLFNVFIASIEIRGGLIIT